MNSSLQIPKYIANMVYKEFGNSVNITNQQLLKQGKWCNANVYKIDINGRTLVIKEFNSANILVRNTIGLGLIGHEVRALSKLDGLPGIPSGIRRLGAYALAMDYIDGQPLTKLAQQNKKLPKQFFEELEITIEGMHKKGFAHLDMRNLGNILCTNNAPCLLDFQTCICTKYLPAFLKNIMEDTDSSAIYKGWRKVCEEPLDPERTILMERFNRTRRLWVFKGYWLEKQISKLRSK